MHPEIYEIIARIRHHGMIAGLISNGYYFQPEKIKKLNEAGLDYLQISIDNVNPDEVSKKSLKVLDGKLEKLARPREIQSQYQFGCRRRRGKSGRSADHCQPRRRARIFFDRRRHSRRDGLEQRLDRARKRSLQRNQSAKARVLTRAGTGFRTISSTAKNTNGDAAPERVISTLTKPVSSAGARSSAARPEFRCSNTRTKIWSANTSPKNGARRPARFNAFIRSDTSTRGATRRFR